MLIALEVAAALGLLVIASDAFTNAVEWLGVLLGLTRSAMGAVVAALGSSLPETMVALVALVVLRDPGSVAVGIGAVVGAPFMLATAVFCLIGITAIVRRRYGNERFAVSKESTEFGLTLFALTFAVAIGASFAPSKPVHIAAAIAVLCSYAVYLAYHLRLPGAEFEEPGALRCAPRSARPRLAIVIVQLVIAVAVTVGASRWFVTSISAASSALGLSPLLVSIVLSPIATEIPEMMNVVIWMRRGHDEVAMGNVLGAMMFQTSIASALALIVSAWRLEHAAYAAAACALAAAVFVLAATFVSRRIPPRALAACGALYIVYLVLAFR